MTEDEIRVQRGRAAAATFLRETSLFNEYTAVQIERGLQDDHPLVKLLIAYRLTGEK